MSKKTLRGGHGAMSKQRRSTANSTKTNEANLASHCGLSSHGRAPIIDPMKTIGHFVLAAFFAVIISQAWLSAQETQSADMRLILQLLLNGKQAQRLYLPAQRWLCSKATRRKKG